MKNKIFQSRDLCLRALDTNSSCAKNVRRNGCKICVVSSKTGYGMDRLEKYVQPGKTIVFLGSSGVGKSSLVNALAGEEIMGTNSIREGPTARGDIQQRTDS